MKLIRVCALGVVLGCCPPKNIREVPLTYCRTPCGLETKGGNCEELTKVETALIREFSAVQGWQANKVCPALAGWELVIHEYRPSDKAVCGSGAWLITPLLCVVGYTHVEYHEVEVADSHWRTNSLAHELVHVIDIQSMLKVGHCRWMERGIKTAIFRATGMVERSQPDSECPQVAQ